MNKEIKKITSKNDFEGSWYTIAGAGGDLQEWVDGYEKLLQASGIEKPVEWYTCKGRDLNKAFRLKGRQCFSETLSFLFFSLDGMSVSRLAPFKIRHGDFWLSDLIQNARWKGK